MNILHTADMGKCQRKATIDTLGQVLGAADTFAALVTMAGQVVQPLVLGQRLEINLLSIFLGLWFGGAFLGIAGIIRATPALVALKVIAGNTSSGKPLMELLRANDQHPNRDVKLRRLAARLENN